MKFCADCGAAVHRVRDMLDGKRPEFVPETLSEKPTCRLNGCGAPAHAKGNGACWTHRAVPADEHEVPVKPVCEIDGCTKPVRYRTRCRSHPRHRVLAGRRPDER